MRKRVSRNRKLSAPWALSLAAAATLAGLHSRCSAQISINQVSGTDWKIANGDLNVVFNPVNDNLTSIAIGSSGNLLNPNNSQLYQEYAGTPFGAGTQTPNYQIGPNGSYIDFWTTTQSQGYATNSSGGYINPITYSFHYVLFNDDPDVVCYEVLNHASTDPPTSVGQGQFIARFNTSLFTQTYQDNVGVNNPGPQTSAIAPTYPADGSPNSNTVDAQPGRNVTDATYDLTSSGLAGDWGSNFNTKYDFATYYQFLQAETIYGSQYSLSTIYTAHGHHQWRPDASGFDLHQSGFDGFSFRASGRRELQLHAHAGRQHHAALRTLRVSIRPHRRSERRAVPGRGEFHADSNSGLQHRSGVDRQQLRPHAAARIGADQCRQFRRLEQQHQ